MTADPHPLTGPRLKMARAKHHFDALQPKVTAYIESEPYEVFVENDGKPGEYVGRVKLHRQPPPEWGITLAESAYQLRSALDLLIYQLARLGPDDPGTRTAFPIFLSSTDYARDRNKYLKGVPEEYWTVIDGLQPYHRGDDAENDPLARLEWITNEDKHHLLVPGLIKLGTAEVLFHPLFTDEEAADVSAGTRPYIEVEGSKLDSTGHVNDGTEIGRVWGVKGNVQVTFRVTTQIAFGSREITLPQFAEIANHVGGIIKGFVPAFGQPPERP